MSGTITESAAQPAIAEISTMVKPSSPEIEPSRTTEETWKPRGWRWWLASAAVLTLALAALVPTTGDFGLTWDEPAYRYSQIISAQWWEQLWHARSWNDIGALLEPDALLYYWPYARSGINFHPPLAGQLNLATHALFGSWMKDIPSRRMASVIEFALTLTIGFGFLARRYGAWVGLVMAGSLLLMPRLYGQAHLAETDIPGLLLWAATALAFWNGLHEQHGRPWRVLVGVLSGLAFVEKMAAVGVLVPLLIWMVAGHLPRSFERRGARANWIDGVVTSGLMLLPLGVAFLEIQSLQRQLPPPKVTNLFIHRARTFWPGTILAMPLAVWLLRRLLARAFPESKVWGVERPALETWTAILAFAPVVGWLGNPAWWRETLPRLAHYYTISTSAGRKTALPDIQIIYFGQIYEFSLPWHNGLVLMGITVPVTILLASLIGIVWGLAQLRRDRLPLFFLVHLATLPALRMLNTPAHDGVRLLLPPFFFLAAFAGWGACLAAGTLARLARLPTALASLAVGLTVLTPAAFELTHIHPFELSYYNSLIGGPRGAWRHGFELTYWFDAFNKETLDELNRLLPPGALVQQPNSLTNPPTFNELQNLGALRGDIKMGINPGERQPDRFPFVWMQTQDSKASAFSRLLFAMRPWYAREPVQVDGLRLVTVADPVAVSRAWALQALLDATDESPPDPPAAPQWVQRYVPPLGRFWGDGLKKINRLTINQSILDWARDKPQGLLDAARFLAAHKKAEGNPRAQRLVSLIIDDPDRKTVQTRQFFLDRLLKGRPEALVEAVEILIRHTDEVVKVMTRYGYTDPQAIGGFLDRDLPEKPEKIAAGRSGR